MSKKTIENPKVFISYAWGSKDYQNKVLAFASQLVGDGIEVIFDKWDLVEGNDTNAFMEKCASDESITNVIMLLDPIYAQKADDRQGGVGKETQIISQKVYKEVNQDKFIPIIFARNDNDEVCKPTYLQGRLHFDLSRSDNYNEEYQRLVKKLYGVEIYKKPELGEKPSWVEKETDIGVKKIIEYEEMKGIKSLSEKKLYYRKKLQELEILSEELIKNNVIRVDPEGIISSYEDFNQIKHKYLSLIKHSLFVDDSEKLLSSFLEKLYQNNINKSGYKSRLFKPFLHELFLYTIAYFIKNEEYSKVGYLLGKTYFDPGKYFDGDQVSSYLIFYSGMEDILSDAVKSKDNKNYYSGDAKYWISNIETDFCSKDDFVFSDLMCFNYSLYGKYYIGRRKWFPLLYVYDNQYTSLISGFSKKLVSREFVLDILPLFGFETIEELKGSFEKVEKEIKEGHYRDYRYGSAFESPAIISEYIEACKIASFR